VGGLKEVKKMPKCSSVDCRKYLPSIPGCKDKTCIYDDAAQKLVAGDTPEGVVFFKYCPICQRYVQAKKFEKHMEKHEYADNKREPVSSDSGTDSITTGYY
jgi:hypothetical protein